MKTLCFHGVRRDFGHAVSFFISSSQRDKAQPVVLDMDVLYPLAPFSLFIVGGAVLKALDFVLFLRKLPLHLFFLGLQLFDFFFGHNFDLLTDR